MDLEKERGIALSAYNVGRPYGEKSFHNIKMNYWNSQFVPVKLFPFLHLKRGRKYREYKKTLFKRYRYLVRYFLFTCQDIEESLKFQYEDRLLLLEVKELIAEMVSSGVDIELLIPIFDKEAEICEIVCDNFVSSKTHNLYQLFGSIIDEASETLTTKEKTFRIYYLNRYMILPLFILVLFLALFFLFATFR
jgi:hypothetical protein